MATPLTGTQVAQLTTPSLIWDSARATIDTGENYFYYFDNTGVLYRTALPGLGAPSIIPATLTLGNIRRTINDPASANFLILFDKVDGAVRLNVTTGSTAVIMSVAAIDAATYAGFMESMDLARACPDGTILIANTSDGGTAGGRTWRFNPATPSIALASRTAGLKNAMCPGIDQSNDVIRAGYSPPYLFVFNIDSRDEFTVLAGTGADGDVTGNAYAAKFTDPIPKAWISSDSDIVYLSTGGGIRYIKDESVGSVTMAGNPVVYLPIRNRFITMGAQEITIFS